MQLQPPATTPAPGPFTPVVIETLATDLAQINRTLRQELNLVMNNRTPPLPRQ
jgi:hypothetical protein